MLKMFKKFGMTLRWRKKIKPTQTQIVQGKASYKENPKVGRKRRRHWT